MMQYPKIAVILSVQKNIQISLKSFVFVNLLKITVLIIGGLGF
jgi:hypothetical protein